MLEVSWLVWITNSFTLEVSDRTAERKLEERSELLFSCTLTKHHCLNLSRGRDRIPQVVLVDLKYNTISQSLYKRQPLSSSAEPCTCSQRRLAAPAHGVWSPKGQLTRRTKGRFREERRKTKGQREKVRRRQLNGKKRGLGKVARESGIYIDTSPGWVRLKPTCPTSCSAGPASLK
ncbi:hypothetical protein M9H77_08057 [Catharanthus roseus]|uniref:Uncharacterized protein n=1 Tax=Catharanthus roseus TaxID=4058 RepID=A0ACC0BWM6_CATRO|nr:hypothetical protein M9H77_08057 [Catharanthus roseus]